MYKRQAHIIHHQLQAQLLGDGAGHLHVDALEAAGIGGHFIGRDVYKRQVLVFSTQEEADDARKALEARVSDQKDACEGYLPAELPKLEQAIVKESGSSVLLVVANDSQAAQAALDGLAQ